MIKNILEYYYNIKPDRISQKNSDFYFYNNGKEYILEHENNNLNYSLIKYVNNILHGYNIKQYMLITTNTNAYYITFNKSNYILLLKTGTKSLTFQNIFIDKNNLQLKSLYKNNWKELWQRKIDFFEYELENKKNNYEKISDLIIYYIGMGENAIQYLNNLDNFITSDLILQQKILDKKYEEYIKPYNVIIDSSIRRDAEIIKYNFWNSKTIIKNPNLNNYSKNEIILLYSRLLFPTYFWDDLYKLSINKKSLEEFNIYYNSNIKYLAYITSIMTGSLKKHNLEEIEWIKKAINQ